MCGRVDARTGRMCSHPGWFRCGACKMLLIFCDGEGMFSMGRAVLWILLGVAIFYWVQLKQDIPAGLSGMVYAMLGYVGFGKGGSIVKDIKTHEKNKENDYGKLETGGGDR